MSRTKMPMDRATLHLQASMRQLEETYPGCAIVLLIAPTGAPPGARANYVSNAKRPEMVALMKEMVARFDGRQG